MALDLQQRPAQHGHRRDHTRYETENGRVVLQADPIKNGGITQLKWRISRLVFYRQNEKAPTLAGRGFVRGV